MRFSERTWRSLETSSAGRIPSSYFAMFTRTFTFLLIALHAIAVLSLPARTPVNPKKPNGTEKPANGGNTGTCKAIKRELLLLQSRAITPSATDPSLCGVPIQKVAANACAKNKYTPKTNTKRAPTTKGDTGSTYKPLGDSSNQNARLKRIITAAKKSAQDPMCDNIVHPVLLDKVLFDNRLCTYFDALAGIIGTSATSKLSLKTQWLKQAITHTNKASGNTVNLRSVPKALYTAKLDGLNAILGTKASTTKPDTSVATYLKDTSVQKDVKKFADTFAQSAWQAVKAAEKQATPCATGKKAKVLKTNIGRVKGALPNMKAGILHYIVVTSGGDEEPTKSEDDDPPMDDEPVDDEPVEDEPVDDEPVDDEPVDDEPVDDEPVDDEEPEEEV